MPAPSTMSDLSTTASSNYPAGTDVPATLDDAIRALAAVVKTDASKGVDIASASSITIPEAGSYFVVTGTTTITAIANASWTGREVTLKFSGALTLTHGSGLILPGSANITTAAGDVFRFVYESSGVWRCVNYEPTSSTSYQPLDSELTALAGLTSAANKVPMFSGSGTATLIDFKDEDDMASDSATAVPSQQSVKAYVQANASNITLGTEQASTSGTAIDFTGIPSGTKRVTVMFVGVGTNGTSNLLIQLGDSGGVETTGYESNAATLTNNNVVDSTAGIVCTSTFLAASTHHGAITFTLEDAVNNTWVATGILIDSGNVYSHFCAGSKSLSASLDRVRVTSVNGTDTFDSGSVNIAYE